MATGNRAQGLETIWLTIIALIKALAVASEQAAATTRTECYRASCTQLILSRQLAKNPDYTQNPSMSAMACFRHLRTAALTL